MSDFEKRYAAMSAEEKAAGWDAYHRLGERQWLLYKCSDCDPDPVLKDPDEEFEYEGQGTAMLVLPSDIARPDHCPRCGNYLSLDEGMPVRVTTAGVTQ